MDYFGLVKPAPDKVVSLQGRAQPAIFKQALNRTQQSLTANTRISLQHKPNITYFPRHFRFVIATGGLQSPVCLCLNETRKWGDFRDGLYTVRPFRRKGIFFGAIFLLAGLNIFLLIHWYFWLGGQEACMDELSPIPPGYQRPLFCGSSKNMTSIHFSARRVTTSCLSRLIQ